MRLFVLGSAAGGGYPQWNCLCDVCRLYWAGDGRVNARGQSSIAASADGRNWLLLNASPDLRGQILAAPRLAPAAKAEADDRRATPIGAVLVTNGDVDHIAGLLTLREKQRFPLYGTAGVLAMIADNPVFSVLDPGFVEQRPVTVGTRFEPLPGLEAEIFSVPGKVPLFMETGEVAIGEEGEMTVGVRLSAHGRTAFYIPGCAHVPETLKARLDGADALLFDGTVFVDDEMKRAGVGEKTGRRMGHIPITGEGGSLTAFDGLTIGQKAYIHINNTNPILIAGSPERRAVEAAGWTVTNDGMEIAL
ncbi:pyrroloquinoline quinone biosynthesis protein PqqB [Jiella sp. MQZ9-1]|uniref:Coenzyme PQQ synthesis protein B n=1 Tax=Jiella flava TaxID=2816857 RepID=A0A939G0N1_9HYPH|nr:pyrroloquinoline quinone biosynthesis protein PqqB [Jiella flava]MBO0664201.1 pyrroloquinoline quinone biosynthesis protein PqqB [Jiella flava]MCD2472848.1 pyrroloquinoline quinone biosynthesis protein PqqB [Jiella flava]